MIWFTADTHFGHFNIVKYCNRPFKTLGEMDETMIRNWNEKVGNNDIVYHLGDFCLKEPDKYLERLNGIIYFIRGSHDKKIKVCSKIKEISEIKILNIPNNNVIVLCHYAMRTWARSHYNTWQLYGHSHGRLEPQGKQMDVGVDCNNFFPVSFKEVENVMSKRPDNFNLIKKDDTRHIDMPSEGGFKEAK